MKNTTGPATVSEPITTNTANGGRAVGPVLRPACAMDSAAKGARFFGSRREQRAPKTNERPGVNVSIVCIDFGSAGVSPRIGRPRHRLSAMNNATPSGELDDVGRCWDGPAVRVVGAARNDEHDDADDDQSEHPTDHERRPFARALGVPSMRMTATIGTGR